MNNKNRWIALPLAALIAGCSADANDHGDAQASAPIVLNFTPTENSEGNCTPERLDRAYIGDSGLNAIRGETKYILPSGTTEIPFQSVFKWPNDEGYAKSRSTSMLNYDGGCADLKIEITVEFCEYFTDNGRAKRTCPDIATTGNEGFASVTVNLASVQPQLAQ